MDTVEHYRQLIEKVLSEYAAIPYPYGDLRHETVFDRDRDRYLLMTVGWENGKRVHYTLAHVDIIDGKIWIQKDGTEEGIGEELMAAGVSKNKIVPGFRSEARRRDMGFAVA
ncbi:MAG: XisI protein [Armatimonadetes bacterium]|nr:XisI protein [Armatimonadota bacterium]